MFWDIIHGFAWIIIFNTYHETSNISHTLVGNKIVDHSDVVGVSPVGAAFILDLIPGFNILHKDNCRMRQQTFKFWDLVQLILEISW